MRPNILQPTEIEELVRELSLLYPVVSDAKVVADHAGVNNYATLDKSLSTWHSIVTEAEKQHKLLQLIERGLRDYPECMLLQEFQQRIKEQQPPPSSDKQYDKSLGFDHPPRRVKRIFIYAASFTLLSFVISACVLCNKFFSRDSARLISLSFDTYRDPLIYHVSLHDKPPAETRFVVKPNFQKYIFYTAYVKYTRTPARQGNELLVTAITNSSSYAQWVRTDDVLYREIIGVDVTDKVAFDLLTRRINGSRSAREKLETLSEIMEIEFRVNGLLLELHDFRREPFGYVLSYKNPISAIKDVPATYEFVCKTFQPRTTTNFPFIVSELSRNVDYKLDYSDVSIKSPEFFSAFLFSPNSNPSVANDDLNKVLTVRSKSNEWVLPGGGIIFYWQ